MRTERATMFARGWAVLLLVHALVATPAAWGQEREWEWEQAQEQAPTERVPRTLLPPLPLPAELDPTARTERAAMELDERRDPFNLYLGLDFVSMYVSRGQVFSSKFSVQPWFELDVPLADGEPIGGVASLSVFAGNWNSFQEGDPGLGQARSGSGLEDNWFEADLYGGLRATFFDHFGSSLRFNYYTSPSDSFSDINELDLRLTYNDTHWWRGENETNFALNPSLRIAKELHDRGGPEGWYFQPALRPSFDLTALPGDLRMEIPLILGFGADGQYRGSGGEEVHFGFFQTGVGVGGPLRTFGDNPGSPRWSVAVDVIYVSDRALNFRGDQFNTVGKVGISYSY